MAGNTRVKKEGGGGQGVHQRSRNPNLLLKNFPGELHLLFLPQTRLRRKEGDVDVVSAGGSGGRG